MAIEVEGGLAISGKYFFADVPFIDGKHSKSVLYVQKYLKTDIIIREKCPHLQNYHWKKDQHSA